MEDIKPKLESGDVCRELGWINTSNKFTSKVLDGDWNGDPQTWDPRSADPLAIDQQDIKSEPGGVVQPKYETLDGPPYIMIKTEPEELALPRRETMMNVASTSTSGTADTAILNCNCGYSCMGQEQMNHHTRKRGFIFRDSRLHCAACSYSAANAVLLMRHLKNYCKKTRRCVNCDKVFSSESELAEHATMHTNTIDKPYDCHVCGKCFAKMCHLVVHERRHTGEKPYECHACGQSFSHKASLVVHERRHTGEKPYECHVCGQSFAQKASLVCHERRHTGQKLYQCHVCKRMFAGIRSYRVHQRLHTGEKP